MKNFFSCMFLAVIITACSEVATEIVEVSDSTTITQCIPVTPDINKDLHSKVLVVPANMEEYDYFIQTMRRYAYDAQTASYGVRYNGKKRQHLVITLLKPGKKVTAKYGIIQLKGHTHDMDWCYQQARESIVPGKTIIVSGGCRSSQNACFYANNNVSAFTVSDVGYGPQNDYLVLQMQSLLQDYSYSETLDLLKDQAPRVMAAYVYPN